MESDRHASPSPARTGLLGRLSSFSPSPTRNLSSVNTHDPQSSKHASSSDSDEEEEPLTQEEKLARIEHLLFTAQMDLISHRNSQAIMKLNQAVTLGSSAACATLGNLMSRGVRDANPSLHSPPPPPPLSTSQPAHHYLFRRKSSDHHHLPSAAPIAPSHDEAASDGLAAAKLFIMGLEIELAKPVEREPAEKRGRDGNDSESETDDEDGETVEGREIDLERLLDLVVGLTDSYRFGILLPPASGTPAASEDLPSPTSSTFSFFSKTPTPSSSLFDLGARVALRALNHPLISPQSSTIQHSYLLATKHIPTIQVHLLYLLALHSFPSSKVESEKYWKQILEVGGTGKVTSKDGNELVMKAAMRLNAHEDSTWKLVKKKHKVESAGSPTRPPHPTKKFSGSSMDNMASSSITIRPNPSSAVNIPTIASSPTVSTPPRLSKSPKFHFAPQDDYPSPPASPPSELASDPHSVAESEEDGSKLPSPDSSLPGDEDGKELDPPIRPKTLRRPSSTASFNPPPSLPRLLTKRAESITSISTLPPDFFSSRRLKPLTGTTMVGSNLRSSTTSSSGLGHYSYTPNLSSSDVSEMEPDKKARPEEAVTWKSSFKQRLGLFRATSSKITATIMNGGFFKHEEHESGAVDTLRRVLKKDDASAGPGMYWATEGEEGEGGETDEEAEEVSPRPRVVSAGSYQPEASSSKTPRRPSLRNARSFFDPTSSTPSTAAGGSSKRIPISKQVSFTGVTPTLITTPPTPDKNADLLQASGDLLSKSPGGRVRPRSKSKSRGGGNGDIDPYLLELERKSRVGVKTTCATCGKKGLNFPACPRCKQTYCSRECRIATDGGGDGVRHQCGSKGKGKAKIIEG